MKKKSIAVTGASGFIGKNVVPLLLAKGYNVIVVGRAIKKIHGGTVTYVQADLRKEFPIAVAKKVSAIVHLGGVVAINESLALPRVRIEENLAMTLSVLEAARMCANKPLVLFTSTDRVYGKTKKRLVNEREPIFPIEPYTASKILGEAALETYAAAYAVPYIILRLDSVYGPGQPRSMFISDCIQKALHSEHIETGPLTVKKNFVYVGDVADAITAALRAPSAARNSTYNIGGDALSLQAVLTTILSIVSKKRGVSITASQRKASGRPSSFEVRPFILSTEKARTKLKWKANTSLYKGLAKTIEYFNTI